MRPRTTPYGESARRMRATQCGMRPRTTPDGESARRMRTTQRGMRPRTTPDGESAKRITTQCNSANRPYGVSTCATRGSRYCKWTSPAVRAKPIGYMLSHKLNQGGGNNPRDRPKRVNGMSDSPRGGNNPGDRPKRVKVSQSRTEILSFGRVSPGTRPRPHCTGDKERGLLPRTSFSSRHLPSLGRERGQCAAGPKEPKRV